MRDADSDRTTDPLVTKQPGSISCIGGRVAVSIVGRDCGRCGSRGRISSLMLQQTRIEGRNHEQLRGD